ncbi:hypothetical protein HZB58_04850 [Candidatus Gottesmanbacteria bacterium]|nr:hypothetical protein [Candidatus Gottesmanbacteria bacterium]
MEGALPNTSALPQKTLKIFVNGEVYSTIIYTLLLGVLFGGVIAAAVYFLPYNRLVVFNQPTATTVKITSVKLSEPAFVSIYMQKQGGWEEVGWARFAKPGYYRDVVIDIGQQQEIDSVHKDNTIGNIEHRAFVARIERPINADTAINENFIREPIRDRRGNIYQKKFWWVIRGSNVKQFFRRLQDKPLTFLWDILWP